MSSLKATWFKDKLKKKAKQGFCGFPVATVAYYGEDDKRASKAAVGLMLQDKGEVVELQRWFSDTTDARDSAEINEAIAAFIKKHTVKSLVVMEDVTSCPHEEGIDFPEGQDCPRCSFWAGKPRSF